MGKENFDLSDFILKSGYRNTLYDVMEYVPLEVLRGLSSEAKEKIKRSIGGTIPPDKMSPVYRQAWDAVNSAESKDSVKKPCREELEYPDFPMVEVRVSSTDHHYALPAGRYYLYYPPQDAEKVKEIDHIYAFARGEDVVVKSGESTNISRFFTGGEFELVSVEDLPPNP